MANATATVSINAYPKGVDNTQRNEVLRGTVAISASPALYVVGGIPLNFASEQLKATTLTPIEVVFAGTSGYTYKWNSVTNTIVIQQVPAASALGSAAPMVELTAAAIPAGVSGDTITFKAVFSRER